MLLNVMRFQQVDIPKNINSFHHLQLLQASGHTHLFERWGRVGCARIDGFVATSHSTIDKGPSLCGECKLPLCSHVCVAAITSFEQAYMFKTGNAWRDQCAGLPFVRCVVLQYKSAFMRASYF